MPEMIGLNPNRRAMNERLQRSFSVEGRKPMVAVSLLPDHRLTS